MKEKYIELCKNEKSIPLFMRYFWLDSVCDNWNVELYEKNNEIVAAFVYVIKSKYGIKYISIPKSTQYNGLWIKSDIQLSEEKKTSLELEVMDYFLDKIEKLNVAFHLQTFSPKIKNLLPFYWKNYLIETKYTLVIKNKNIDDVWNGIASKLRGIIKNATKKATIFEVEDANLFYDFLIKTFERQNQSPRITRDEFIKLDKDLSKRKIRYMIGAKDDEDQIHSICYFVCDDEKMYYLMSGTDSNLRNSNFNSVILWEAIKKATEMGLSFDFEGSMNPNIYSFMRKFGGELEPYYKVSKVYTRNPLLKLIINKKIK